VRTTTWIPETIRVADSAAASLSSELGALSHALLLEDAHESLVIPLARGDARRIGAGLLGYAVCDNCGRVSGLDGHAVGCPALDQEEVLGG
jgi:hypothetical protein